MRGRTALMIQTVKLETLKHNGLVITDSHSGWPVRLEDDSRHCSWWGFAYPSTPSYKVQ
jgi:hypothetical protein